MWHPGAIQDLMRSWGGWLLKNYYVDYDVKTDDAFLDLVALQKGRETTSRLIW
jgi:hypothetical protein